MGITWKMMFAIDAAIKQDAQDVINQHALNANGATILIMGFAWNALQIYQAALCVRSEAGVHNAYQGSS